VTRPPMPIRGAFVTGSRAYLNQVWRIARLVLTPPCCPARIVRRDYFARNCGSNPDPELAAVHGLDAGPVSLKLTTLLMC